MRQTLCVLGGVVFLGAFLSPLGAQSPEEKLTITTYYPSPFGSYNELRARKLALGDAEMPSRAGDMTFHLQAGDPAAWPAGKEGQASYSQQVKALFYYDGSLWRRASGAQASAVVEKNSNINATFPLGMTVAEWPVCFLVGFGSTAGSGAFDDGCSIIDQGGNWAMQIWADGGENIKCQARCLKF